MDRSAYSQRQPRSNYRKPGRGQASRGSRWAPSSARSPCRRSQMSAPIGSGHPFAAAVLVRGAELALAAGGRNLVTVVSATESTISGKPRPAKSLAASGSIRTRSGLASSIVMATSLSQHFRCITRRWSICSASGSRRRRHHRYLGRHHTDACPTRSQPRCDVLIHEAYSKATYHAVSPVAQEYRRRHHTSSVELARIANEAKPGLLVIYHRSNMGGAPTYVDWRMCCSMKSGRAMAAAW